MESPFQKGEKKPPVSNSHRALKPRTETEGEGRNGKESFIRGTKDRGRANPKFSRVVCCQAGALQEFLRKRGGNKDRRYRDIREKTYLEVRVGRL